jgi:hypothetical protein
MREAARAKFIARKLEDGSGWSVLVTLPNGLSRRVDGFKTEREAKSWIRRDSAAWLRRTEGGQHA